MPHMATPMTMIVVTRRRVAVFVPENKRQRYDLH